MQGISQHTEPDVKPFGALTIVAQITVDGAYSINTFTGPIREDKLCFTTADRDLFRRVYAIIGEGGNNGVSPEGIHQALTDELTCDLHAAQRHANGQWRAALIEAALNRLETPAQRDANQKMLDDIAETIRTGRPALSGFGQFRQAHAAAVAADRNARKAVA